ncbi:hypothetical protein F5883DRAFT_473975 [Diaporthe sp. PMI_573]|nr:hypothetical protein F5883DRAFT_473975 [Diaporthaceae sp. PMI_573]
MADPLRSKIIEENPIGNGLEAFRALYKSVCKDKRIPCTPDALGQLGLEDLRKLVLAFLSAAQNFPAARLLPARAVRGTLRSDLLRLELSLDSDDYDLDRVTPLLKAALADDSEDALIWDRVYSAVTESTPPPRPVASSLQQTPWLRNTSSFANSSEHRKYVDNVLKEELGPMYVDLPDFHETYFGDVPNLETASKTFFGECSQGSNPLFNNGWTKWPREAKQDDVLSWFADFSEKLAAFAERYGLTPTRRRRPLAKPDKPIDGSVGKRKMDVGFVNDPTANKDSRCHWDQILIPGELKSNPSADIPSEARLDLGRYAREVFGAQGNRRFVLGFTLCGSLMRVWAFDRLGGIASELFDINTDGLRFVSTILGFLWMSDEQLGFDPTIITANGQQFIEIEREGRKERLVLEKVMKPARCIAGRATTCWRAHREADPHTPIVVKDSWQYVEREQEGKLLREATDKGVVHVARYYYHETVQVRGADDDVRGNVRKELDVTKATNYRRDRSALAPSTGAAVALRGGRSSSIAGTKRSSSQVGAPLPPSKRACSTSPTKTGSDPLPNRVHRRVVLRDYGVPIYEVGSRETLLTALADCIKGHESLRRQAGLLHRDISVGNLMIDKDNRGFLIDLDLAIKEQRLSASGAKGKTGTRAFMAIGALLGEQHSFMHDLESFFWVLFWICIHYSGPGEAIGPTEYESWNYESDEKLVASKIGEIADEEVFLKKAGENFTLHYRPLIPWVNRLRREVFPNGGRWKKLEPELYSSMKKTLCDALKDLEVFQIA